MDRISPKFACAVSLLVFVAVGPVVAGQSAPPAQREGERHPGARSDEQFVRTAAETSMSQVDLGRLAEQRSQNEEVKKFARTMVEDHTRMTEELKQLGSSEHVNLPTNVSRSDADEHRSLHSESGANFDRSYMQQVVNELERQISEFKNASANATRPNVKEFAQHNTSSLESQLQEAKRILNQTRSERR
jgi:putative membrane protein